MPKRIHRKRTRGWRLPEGAIYVGRPTCWGNPFIVLPANGVTPAFQHALMLASPDTCETSEEAVERYRTALIGGALRVTIADVQRELRGKDLACWCVSGPCHADVLLEIANIEN